MQPITISHVARKAGVSESTVSRVMSASRPVTPEIAERVRSAAAELGYSGNSIARALRKKKTDTVGMVVPSILNPFFATLIDSMEQALHAEGKQLLLCDSRQDPKIEADHLRSLLERHVDGIVVSPCHAELSRDTLRAAAASAPLVQLDRRVEADELDWVGIDDDLAMRLVLENLAASGTHSAAFVTSELTNSSTHDRLQGFHDHAARLGIETRTNWVVLGDYSLDSGRQAGHALLSNPTRPEAIVCADDLIAFGVLQACREAGARVPEDLQVTGFDNLIFAEHVTPTLTSIDQPTMLMADEALRLLASRRDRDAEPGARVAFSPRLVTRETTRSGT